MMLLGTDYAASRLEHQVKCLKEIGVRFVVRYLSLPQYSWKMLTRDEAQMIAGQGLGIVSVFQARNTQIADFAPDKADRDASAALQSALEVGQPPGTPIYFAVDFDAQDKHMDTINQYLQRVQNRLQGQYTVGVYGSYRVVEQSVARYRWQTYAWSYGQVSKKAQMIQFRNGVVVCGGAADYNLAFGDPGFWPSPPQDTSFPPMPLVRRGSSGWEVSALQTLLAREGINAGPIDGIFGPKTEAAVREFQSRMGLYTDGIAGPNTWGVLLGTGGKPMPKEPEPDWKALYEAERRKLERIRAILEE